MRANQTVNKTKRIQKAIMLPSRTECPLGARMYCLRSGFAFAVNPAVAHGSFPGFPFLGVVFFGVARLDLFSSTRSAQSGAASPCAIPPLSAPAQSLGAR